MIGKKKLRLLSSRIDDMLQMTVTPGVGLVQGWTDGVLQMREGERAILRVPGIRLCSVSDTASDWSCHIMCWILCNILFVGTMTRLSETNE